MMLLESAKRALGIAKTRAGVYVSRPVLNGAEWNAWAVKWGVPKPLAAANLHVTLVYSQVDVQMVPDTDPIVIPTVDGWSPGCFCRMGPDNQALVFAFYSYDLQDRFWAYQSNGAVSTWPSYRPHMTISADAGDFELPDAALAEAPEFIVLGGEVSGPLQTPDPTDDPADQDDGMGDDDGDEGDSVIVIVLEASQRAAATAAMADPKVIEKATPFEIAALHDMSKGGKVTRRVEKAIGKCAWAPVGLKKSSASPVSPTVKRKHIAEKDLTITIAPLSEDIRKKVGPVADLFKNNDEERLVTGWATVSTVKGDLVTDLQGDQITVKAQRQWLHSLFRGQRAGKFEHEGDSVNEVVEGIVLDADLQKALGIDLGMEGVICVTHVPGDAEWEMAKSGNWMYSIAGRVLVEVEED